MASCKYFLAGRCLYGSSCRNSHDAPTVNPTEEAGTLEANMQDTGTQDDSHHASESSANLQLTEGSVTHIHSPLVSAPALHPVPCRHFAAGLCKNGATCRFQHGVPGDSSGTESQDKAQFTDQHPSTEDTYYVEFVTGIITFKEGIQVSGVKLPSECPTIHIGRIPPAMKPRAVSKILAEFGFTVPESAVMVTAVDQYRSRAVVRLEDSKAAKLVTKKLKSDNGRAFGVGGHGISPTVIQHAARYATHLELCTVNCLWHRQPRMAFVYFDNLDQAATAMALLQSTPELIDRHMAVDGPAGSDNRPYLQVTGLHPDTGITHLDEVLTAIGVPRVIEIGRPTSRLSDEAATARVKRLLYDVGGLQYFTPREPTADARGLRATAGFADRTSAIRAVQRLNNRRFESLANARLIIARRLAITYYASAEIVKAVEGQLQTLSREVKVTSQVNIASYITTEKKSATIRCWAEAESSIAHINAAIERLLTGDVIMDRKSPLWHPWFAKVDGLASINKIASENNVHIFRELPLSQLRVFGAVIDAMPWITQSLLAAVASATSCLHYITLSQEMLLSTINSGLARLQDKFGSAVSLGRTGGGSHAVILYGSTKDFQVARSLIVEDDTSIQEELKPDDCPVCCCITVEPVKLFCGHTYCRECFDDASASAVENPPFRCIGHEGSCNHLVGVKELVQILPYPRCQKIFKDAFAAYVRTHPKELRYCPTPECSSLYRPSEEGFVFTCFTCVSAICTTCHVQEHNGITCEEWRQYHADGGERALQQYKVENDVRDCPKCKAAIEKNEGCMHLQCRNCMAHICWFCMEGFDQEGIEECVGHMSAKHGGLYNQEDPNYAPESESSDGEDGDDENNDPETGDENNDPEAGDENNGPLGEEGGTSEMED